MSDEQEVVSEATRTISTIWRAVDTARGGRQLHGNNTTRAFAERVRDLRRHDPRFADSVNRLGDQGRLRACAVEERTGGTEQLTKLRAMTQAGLGDTRKATDPKYSPGTRPGVPGQATNRTGPGRDQNRNGPGRNQPRRDGRG